MKGQRKPPNRTALVVLSAIAGVLVLFICIGVIGGIMASSDDDPDASRPATPAYTVVSQKDGDIVVEVDQILTEEQTRAIATELRDKQTEETGYFVSINCSTGGTAKADNRLGNARFGIGALGKARTGLDEGQIDVKVNEGRTCPAS